MSTENSVLALLWKYLEGYDFPAISLVCKPWFNFIEERILTYKKTIPRLWVCCLEGSGYGSLRVWAEADLPRLRMNADGALFGADLKKYLPIHSVVFQDSLREVNGMQFLGFRHNLTSNEVYYGLIQGNTREKIWLKPLVDSRTSWIDNNSGDFSRVDTFNSLTCFRMWTWNFKKAKITFSGLQRDPYRLRALISESAQDPDQFAFYIKNWCISKYRPLNSALMCAIQHKRYDLIDWIVENGHVEPFRTLPRVEVDILDHYFSTTVSLREKPKAFYALFQHDLLEGAPSLGSDAVDIAAREGDLEFIKYSRIHAKWKWEWKGGVGEIALTNNHWHIIDYLFEVQPTTIFETTFRIWASSGEIDLMKKYHEEYTCPGKVLGSALSAAVASNQIEAARWLMSEPNCIFSDTPPPMELACRSGNLELVELLLPHKHTIITETALFFAIASAPKVCAQVATLLFSSDKFKPTFSSDFRCPIECAIRNDLVAVARVIFDYLKENKLSLPQIHELCGLVTSVGMLRIVMDYQETFVASLESERKQEKEKQELDKLKKKMILRGNELDNLQIIQYIVEERGCDPSFQKNYALCDAVRRGKLAVIQYLCSYPLVQAGDWTNAFNDAVDSCKIPILDFFFSQDWMDPSMRDNLASRIAFSTGNPAVILRLLRHPKVFESFEVTQGLFKAYFCVQIFSKPDLGIQISVPTEIRKAILVLLNKVLNRYMKCSLELKMNQPLVLNGVLKKGFIPAKRPFF